MKNLIKRQSELFKALKNAKDETTKWALLNEIQALAEVMKRVGK